MVGTVALEVMVQLLDSNLKTKVQQRRFLALAGGDTTAAKEQIDAKIDVFEDNRSQTAVERLQTMADKLEEKATKNLKETAR